MEVTDFFPPKEDLKIRWTRIQALLKEVGGDACLMATTVNIYYLTGKVFTGFVYLPVEGEPLFFVQRPANIEEEQVIFIRKPEEIAGILQEKQMELPQILFLESDQLTYNEFIRLQTAFNISSAGNATALIRKARMIKTPWEVEQFRISAAKHSDAYKQIPDLFKEGMTDIDFQAEIERYMRKQGSLGIFRTFGSNMDIFMGSILAGANAESASPYDFALGGGGLHPSIPIGVNGATIKKGTTVMVDMAGNYTAYMTDMTRVFSYGTLPEIAYKVHTLSIDMHNWLMDNGKPGLACSTIYNHTVEMAEQAGFSSNFMGTLQQAKFVGHGVGIEINELPVLMGRSKDLLQPGMVFAFEPKFVLPGIGAVGNENTFLVTDSGIEKLTIFDEKIRDLILIT